MTKDLKTLLRINLSTIRENYEVLKTRCHGAKVGASVKANCYGLGMEKIVPILLKSGCQDFFVANCQEGVDLRYIVGNTASIYVFHGVFEDEIEIFKKYNLIPVLNHLQQISIWQNHACNIGKKLPCIIHVDTGMNRLGMPKLELGKFNLSTHTKNLEILYVMSHLSSSNNLNSKYNEIQLKKFMLLEKIFPKLKKSLANSGGIFLGKKYHFDLVRPGASIYGLNTSPHIKNSGIKTTISLTSTIIQTSYLQTGESVGYDTTFTNKNETSLKIAVIPVGYADGIMYNLSNRGKVFIQGYESPIIGRVSMDLTVIDISNIPDNIASLGQEVEIIGKYNSPEKISELSGANIYEVLTSLGSRYKRIYSD